LHENTGDVLFTVGKLNVLMLVSYPQNAEKQRRRRRWRRGIQTDMATEGRLHLCHKFIALHSTVHSHKTYD
jgi:hypothetical protein